MSMLKVPYFDICSVIILAFLFIASVYRKMTKGRVNRYYIYTIAATFFSALFDICAILLDNLADPSLKTVQIISHTGYLYLHSITPIIYLIYLVALTDTFHKLKKIGTTLIFAPNFILVVLLAANFFTESVFSVANGVYKRGPLIYVLYIIGFAYCVTGAVYLTVYRRLFSKMKFTALIIMLPALLAAVLVQLVFPIVRVEIFSITLGLMFISSFIHRPEAVLDYDTNLFKFSAYAQDMKRSFMNEKRVNVIMVNIANFLTLQEVLSYESIDILLKIISKELVKIDSSLKLGSILYYLDKGRFRMVISAEKSELTERAAEMINEALKADIELNGMEINLVSCVCTANCPDDISDFSTLIAFGKDLGTKIVPTGSVMHASQIVDQKRYNLMSDIDSVIENAMANNRFDVYYQPIYSVKDRCFTSAEALIRLKDDKYGFVSPELFIPAAEKSGAIHKIGAYVLDEVCKFISSPAFTELGLSYIEINLSVVQCMQNGLADEILSLLKKYNISTDKINLEITETADSTAQSVIGENIEKLRNAGVTFSLDDFGTGYSNIQRMASMPLKIVKLDKTFVRFNDNPKLMIVLQNTVKMLKSMDMEIVVEGIETQELVDRFTDMNCDYIQGYFFSRPIPRAEFITFIAERLPVNS